MTEKKWETIGKIKNQKSKIKIEDIVKTLIKNRGIRTKAQEREFFNPAHPDKLKPHDFGIDPRQLKKAVKRIKGAKKSGERVIVWGDYDADGICGTAVLWEALYYSGINALPFIPERRSEGYGLNIQRMKQLKKEDPSVGLIITVDNGIVAHEKVDTARELGVDVIITDHHIPRKTKPRAFAILHTTSISGAGVAYLLAREIRNPKSEIRSPDWLGIVALATVADMVPILGPTRSLVYYGIPILQRTKRPGIVALSKVSGINQEGIGTYEIGFILAPRLNAMGRLEHALESLRLLCTKSQAKAATLANLLNQTNAARQQMVVETVIHAREQVLRNSDGGLIFIVHESYHEGIVGLVASRLVEEFRRPAMVVAKGEEFSRGSARSIPGFNIIELLEAGREFLVEGGGHPMAAGFTVRTEHVELLARRLGQHADSSLTKEHLTSKIVIDCEIPLSVISLELAQKIAEFSPFGVGNPEPVFATRGVLVENARLVGNENQHLKMTLGLHLKGVSVNIDAIGFGMGEFYSRLSPEKPVDIAYVIQIDEWPVRRSASVGGNGEKKLELKIRDIRIA